VLTAPNGKEGVRLAQEHHPELILCDIMMPGLDGHGVLYILRNNPETANIPFIFLTAKAGRDDFRTGMNLGADDYITKPFDATDLLKGVETRLKRSHQLKVNAGDQQPAGERAMLVKDFVKLVENKPVRTVKKNSPLFLEGQIPSELFYVRSGYVKTFKLNSDGKEFITGLYMAGNFLGYAQLLDDHPYEESAETLEDSQISVISRSDFLKLMDNSKEVARKFIGMLTSDVRHMEDRLLEIAYQSVRQRVAGIILRLDAGGTPGRTIAVSRKNLANLVGTAPESFNRTVADFKGEGLIDILRDGIRIINRPKLEQLVK
jgi:CRP-like cAMP-binding protein